MNRLIGIGMKTSLSILLIAACAVSAFGQRGNTDESKVPEYTLPDIHRSDHQKQETGRNVKAIAVQCSD